MRAMYDSPSEQFTGIFWGAFDLPTEAHIAIIKNSILNLPLKKLIIVVNNSPYKKYKNPLNTRLQMMEGIIRQCDRKNVELLSQDESHPVDFKVLKEITEGPLCAIAGYDSYKRWVLHSKPHDRSCYEAIAVVPRGDEEPILYDKMAFLLPIDVKYKHISSSRS
jgi:nicotinic acid mononucleotide adenylyltransferase